MSSIEINIPKSIRLAMEEPISFLKFFCILPNLYINFTEAYEAGKITRMIQFDEPQKAQDFRFFNSIIVTLIQGLAEMYNLSDEQTYALMKYYTDIINKVDIEFGYKI